jgi:hypothetical protein
MTGFTTYYSCSQINDYCPMLRITNHTFVFQRTFLAICSIILSRVLLVSTDLIIINEVYHFL